jgi:hypothetical protein
MKDREHIISNFIEFYREEIEESLELGKLTLYLTENKNKQYKALGIFTRGTKMIWGRETIMVHSRIPRAILEEQPRT